MSDTFICIIICIYTVFVPLPYPPAFKIDFDIVFNNYIYYRYITISRIYNTNQSN